MGYAALPAIVATTVPFAGILINSVQKLFSFGVGGYYGAVGVFGIANGAFQQQANQKNANRAVTAPPLKERVIKTLSPLHNARLYSVVAGVLFFSVGFFQVAYCVHTLTSFSLGALGPIAHFAAPPLLVGAFFFELCRQGARYQVAKKNLIDAVGDEAKKKATMMKLSAALSVCSTFFYLAMAALALFNPIGWYVFLILALGFALKSASVLIECILLLQKKNR